MTATLTPAPKIQFFADDGTPLAGGKLYTYAAGTTTPLASYTAYAGTVANTNPVILDSRGEANVWLSGVGYKLALYRADNTLVWTVDNVFGQAALADVLAASSGSSLVGYLPSGTGAVATTVQTKLRESVSVKDFGAKGDGATDDTAAIQAAATLGVDVFIPAGTYKINGSISPNANTAFFGVGYASQIKQFANAPFFIFPIVAGRNKKHFRNFACLTNGNVAASQPVFSFPGTPSGAAVVYTSGYEFSSITIGNGDNIGCGFFLSDTFRCDIHDISMTNVSCMVDMVGNVVQCSLARIFNNNDSGHSGYGKNIGFDTAYKSTYLDALSRGPENTQIINCGAVSHNIGARITGLFIHLKDNDLDFCTTNGIIYGGGSGISFLDNYIASSTASSGFVGILVPNTASAQEPVIVRGNIIYAYSSLSGASTGIRYGDGNVSPYSEPEGAVISDNFIKAPSAYWEFGIDLDRNVKVSCNNNNIINGSCRTNAIRATYQKDTTLIGNDCGAAGTIALTSPTTAGQGVAINNRGVMTVSSMGGPQNWFLFNNTGTGGRHDNYVTGNATYDPPSLTAGLGATTTVSVVGAIMGGFTQASFSLDLQGITVTSWVSTPDVVSVRFQNQTSGTLDLASGLLRIRVLNA
jgi:hypothetical protein